MRTLTCVAARRRLHAFHDGELPVGEQIAMAAHLDRCRACAESLAEFRAVGDALRAASARRVALSRDEAAGFCAGVVNRVKAEHESSVIARVRDMFDDMHLVYAGLGAAAAGVACVIIMLGTMRSITNERPDSLAAMVAFLATPGSSANAAAVDAASHRRFTARLSGANETAEEDAVFTLAAVLTREGRIAKLEHLRASGQTSAHDAPTALGVNDAKLVEGLLDVLSRARFEPAQAEGTPSAANMVWLITRTTVRASQSSQGTTGDLQLPAPPAAKKRAATMSAARPPVMVA
jgi:anti-sigma factor RsiW